MRAAKRIGDDHVRSSRHAAAAETKSAKAARSWTRSAAIRAVIWLRVVPSALAAAPRLARLDVSGRIVTPKADIAAAVKLFSPLRRGFAASGH